MMVTVMLQVGGRDGSACLRSVECYDPHTNKWTTVASLCKWVLQKIFARNNKNICTVLRRRRGGVAVGVLNGFLYAVGGHDAPAVSNPQQSRCVTNTGIMTMMIIMMMMMMMMCRFSCMERYDPATDPWTLVASLSIGRDAIGVCVLGQKLFAGGSLQYREWSSQKLPLNIRSHYSGTFHHIYKSLLPQWAGTTGRATSVWWRPTTVARTAGGR